MAFAGAGPADQYDIALPSQERSAGEISDQRLIDQCVGEHQVAQPLGQRQLGDTELVADRAHDSGHQEEAWHLGCAQETPSLQS